MVSTVLWLMGTPQESGTSNDDEDHPKMSTRTLSWKDEHDGPIAEYIGSPKAIARARVEKKKEESSMSRKSSLTALPRNDSDVSKQRYIFPIF